MINGNFATCHWFKGDREDNNELGHCHYDSPASTGFPTVYSDDWCGDHQCELRSEKGELK